MNDDLQQLHATVAALRTELDETKARLAKMERVINIEEGEDGNMDVYIECSDLVVRTKDDPRFIAVHLGCNDDGGYVDVPYAGEEHAMKTAIRLSLGDDGEPHIQLRGKDWKVRADMFIDGDHGAVAVIGPNDVRGAVMRALPGGGSVAVLQPDGKPRGVLIHDEFHKTAGREEATPTTNLIFVTTEAKTVLKLEGDAEGSLVCVGHPTQPDAAVIMSRKEGATIMLTSPTKQTSVSIAAMDGMARIAAHEGMAHEKKAEACLLAGTFGGSAGLHDCDGRKRVDLHASECAGGIHLLDDAGKEAVALSHFADSHSSLAMRGVSEHDCVRIIANKDLVALRITSPSSEDTAFATTVQDDKATVFLTKDKQPRVMLGEAEQGGIVCAYGLEPEKAGCAALAGGPITGSLSLSMTDGTAQLTLDGTDHGGRLLINNDLGFQRVAMGVYQESAGLHLNHTGSMGVQALATPKGGAVIVCNHEGQPTKTIRGDDDDDT